MKRCYRCKHEVEIGRSIARRDTCPHCRFDLHCCLNCAFYDPTASKQCREPMAELVKIKERSNFCDYFVFAESQDSGIQDTKIEKSRKTLEDLFKK